MKNALTFDLEDWYQLDNSDIKFGEWHYHESRIEKNVYKILAMLRKYNAKATFFVSAWIAEKFPELIENIAFEGHEIASHGYKHELVNNQTKEEFEKDLIKSIDILRDITNQRVIGYRAPNLSITKKSFWALEILGKNGIEYDSSIFPVKKVKKAPKGIHNTNHGVIEFPVSTVKYFGINLYFSAKHIKKYPLWLTKQGIQKINNKKPAMLYLRFWELDFSDKENKKTIDKLKQILNSFQFDSIKNILFFEDNNL